MNINHYKAVNTGARSKAAGDLFENMVNEACRYYSERGEAEIEKTPEPMKPLRRLEGGKFVAVYTKMAQPDYKGTFLGGKSIVFEAKHTDSDRLKRDVVSEEQEKRLEKHYLLGAECFVLISFGFQKFFKVPWNTFRDMKRIFGRKYLVPQDLKNYEIKYIGGILRFLYQ